MKISIIVPFYNSEHVIGRCIDSILNQSFSDFELLLVNDGCTDNSEKKCLEYAKWDKRIVLLSKENGGVSSARNLGLEKARGEWIVFVDSDDYVMKDYLLNLYNGLGPNPPSETIVIGNVNGGRRKLQLITQNVTLESEEMRRYVLGNRLFIISAPYSKIFNHHIIKKYNIRFPLSIHMGEDMVFLGMYMNYVKRATFIQDSDYFVSDYGDSLSKKYYSFQSEMECFNLWIKEITAFVSASGYTKTEVEKLIWINRTSATFLRCLESLYKSNNSMSFSTKLTLLKSIPSQYFASFLQYHNSNNVNQRIIKFFLKFGMYRTFLILGTVHRKLKEYFEK